MYLSPVLPDTHAKHTLCNKTATVLHSPPDTLLPLCTPSEGKRSQIKEFNIPTLHSTRRSYPQLPNPALVWKALKLGSHLLSVRLPLTLVVKWIVLKVSQRSPKAAPTLLQGIPQVLVPILSPPSSPLTPSFSLYIPLLLLIRNPSLSVPPHPLSNRKQAMEVVLFRASSLRCDYACAHASQRWISCVL